MDLNKFRSMATPTPEEIDSALGRLKRDLTVRAMRRALLTEELDGRSAKALVDAILRIELQTA